MLARFRDIAELPATDFCVIGAGPAGIALSLALAASGHSVLLIESGEETPDASTSELTQAQIRNTQTHAPAEIAACRAFGGTSWWWGGRCVPFDKIDFEDRSYAAGTQWPISYDEIRIWHPKVAEFFGCGSGEFEKDPGIWSGLGEVSARGLERWTPTPNLNRTFIERVRQSDSITLLLGATLTDIELAADKTRIRTLTLADRGKTKKLDVQACVLACGGLETTRIMLVANRKYPTLFQHSKSVLGRFYMGHISGKIADVVLDNPASIAELDFFKENDHFARRRFTLQEDTLKKEELINIAFWIDNPPFYNASHGNGILSAVWLMLAIPFIGRRLVSEGVRISHVGPAPFQITLHLKNIYRSPITVARTAVQLLRDRYLSSPRKPGFLVRNRGGRYALHYHAEQLPMKSSSVSLSEKRDSLGVPRLVVDFKYSERDAQSVVRAHEVLDRSLREAKIGHLEFRAPREHLVSSVLAQASDGFHQLGTTRMSLDPSAGIVDQNCRVHGLENLFLVSGSVFPSSGQANPTFLVVALALRLAGHLASTTARLATRSSLTAT
ncbi:GMC oxidoreductase [Bradyrhizobium sp. Ec3.3]|uniref:GMC oxidoreductase n=1 Tax=Bradyrhizobium sp. Ec3.3 TaxID=189753 RepID=UPI0003F85537|nr:GMC oxidoreductase [Bradyrhizobium sp. Ec3.3]